MPCQKLSNDEISIIRRHEANEMGPNPKLQAREPNITALINAGLHHVICLRPIVNLHCIGHQSAESQALAGASSPHTVAPYTVA